MVKAADPLVFTRPQVNLSIFQYRVPMGTISRSADFWKRVDENAVNAPTHDILQRNGIRVGIAPYADMESFLKVLAGRGTLARPWMLVASNVRTFEVPMKEHVDSQVIYHYDEKQTFPIRSYDNCDNVFVLEFQPAPRRAGDVRLGIVPMVRSLRKKLVAIGDIDTREIEVITPEKLFELNLKTDLAVENFLIVGPSAEASARMSLGHAFLVEEGQVKRYENVLLIIPQAVQMNEARAEKPSTGRRPAQP